MQLAIRASRIADDKTKHLALRLRRGFRRRADFVPLHRVRDPDRKRLRPGHRGFAVYWQMRKETFQPVVAVRHGRLQQYVDFHNSVAALHGDGAAASRIGIAVEQIDVRLRGLR